LTTSSSVSALAGGDNITLKPAVKHILSKELQLYFERICSAILSPPNTAPTTNGTTSSDEYRLAALASLRTDPGLHQLVPYFIQFVAEKVTHNLRDLFTLTQMLHLVSAILENPSLYIDPYVASLVPPVLTCLIGRRLGPSITDTPPGAHFSVRDLAASLLIFIAKKYGKTSHTLKPRLARTMLKEWLDPQKPLGTHYGALMGLQGITGAEGVRTLVLPNLRAYDEVLREGMEDEGKSVDAEAVVVAIVRGLEKLEADWAGMTKAESGDEREKVVEKVGEIVGGRVVELGRPRMVAAILDAGVD